MSAEPRGEPSVGQACRLGEPFYFDSGDHTLFGWLHQPAAENVRNIGLLICSPFGYEAICSHNSLRAFAAASAEMGVPALRFDYLGTGDSGDIDPRANQLEVWSTDVLSAIEELKRRTGVERVCLLGIRLGGLLATMAAEHCDSVASLILISPIISGRRYVRELRTTKLAASHGADAQETENRSQAVNDGSMEASGYLFSAATLAALAQVDIMQGAPPAPEMLIIDGSSMPVARRWADALAAAPAARARYLALPGLIEMIMTMPHDAKPPEAMLGAMRDWLDRPPNASTPLNNERHTLPFSRDARATAAQALELPGETSAPDENLTERPVLLESESATFGIVTEPRKGEVRRRAVIIVNAGATYHIGPNRVYVSLARRWARSGYLVLRMDLSGLGDSGARPGQPSNEVYPSAALDDIRAAVHYVRDRYGIDDVALCGFCSGAYHAFRAAVAAIPVNRILMVNLENFFWKEGTDRDSLELAEVVKRTHGHREKILSFAAWKRLVTGQINVWRIVQIYIQRPLLAMESVVRDWARFLHIRLPRDVGWELEDLAKRGVRMVFAFARGEPGFDLLRIQGGSSTKRLGESCHIYIIDRADHIFSQSSPRADLERILSNELFAQHRMRGIPSTNRPILDSSPTPMAVPTPAASNHDAMH
jgi:pimeloyl-ACP methyl ester carboxylesterase